MGSGPPEELDEHTKLSISIFIAFYRAAVEKTHLLKVFFWLVFPLHGMVKTFFRKFIIKSCPLISTNLSAICRFTLWCINQWTPNIFSLMPSKFTFAFSKRKSLFVSFSVQVNKSNPEFWCCWNLNQLPARSSEEDQLQFSREILLSLQMTDLKRRTKSASIYWNNCSF